MPTERENLNQFYYCEGAIVALKSALEMDDPANLAQTLKRYNFEPAKGETLVDCAENAIKIMERRHQGLKPDIDTVPLHGTNSNIAEGMARLNKALKANKIPQEVYDAEIAPLFAMQDLLDLKALERPSHYDADLSADIIEKQAQIASLKEVRAQTRAKYNLKPKKPPFQGGR